MREKVECGWTSGVAETMNQQETFNTNRLLKFGVCRGAKPLAGSLRVSLRYNFLLLPGQGWGGGNSRRAFLQPVKGQRREAERRKRRRMKVTGTGVKRLQAIILRRAQKAPGFEESDG